MTSEQPRISNMDLIDSLKFGFSTGKWTWSQKDQWLWELGQVRDQRSVKPEMTHENQDWLTSCLDACERY